MTTTTQQAMPIPEWLQSAWLEPLESLPRLRALRRKLGLYPPPAVPGTVLNRMEQALISAVADALFPPGGLFPLSGTEAGMVEYFDSYLRRCRAQEGLLLRLLLIFTELSPMAFGPRFTAFSRLSLEHRTDFLRQAAHSRIYLRRVAFTSMRALMTMGYLSNPRIASHMGFVAHADPFGIGEGEEESP